ncbi:MAG: metallophosphoesterase [Rubrobacteraceae bacterium]
MLELRENTLVVFVSDSHIGGDPGCDGFESPEELQALLDELADHEGPVELILAGDFFDFLQIGDVPEGMNRASLTIERPEYEDMFASLKSFRESDGKRVIYLPGNHDAEVWWNPEIQKTLRERGLVDEFAFYYTASIEVDGRRRTIYCEHGNQLDSVNTVRDYEDPLDTPLGHHVVMDFTRRIAPLGEVKPGLNLGEIKNVFPLSSIPQWVASRYFYDFVGKVAGYLLLPLFVAYVVYRAAAYAISVSRGDATRFFGGFQELPAAHLFFTEIAAFGFTALVIFAVFLLIIRRAVRKAVSNVSFGEKPRYSPAEASRRKVEAILEGEVLPPMDASIDPQEIDVFVSGHTHLPSLDEVMKPNGGKAVMVNSGCWLRQLQPITPHLKGPSVFVSKFVLTHVRVFARESELRVELWEQPKPAGQRLTRIERLLSWGRRPQQPPVKAKSQIRASANV